MRLAGLLLGAAVLAAIPAFAGDGHARHARMRAAKARLAAFESLNFTPEQRRLMIEKARAIAPIVDAAKAEARRLVANALVEARTGDREAIRAQVKESVKALREDAARRIAPHAREVVQSLTPEQRSRIADFASKHGKTVDDEALVRRFGRALARPMALAYLEALDAAPTTPR